MYVAQVPLPPSGAAYFPEALLPAWLRAYSSTVAVAAAAAAVTQRRGNSNGGNLWRRSR